MSLLRSPWLHFLLLGALIFIAQQRFTARQATDDTSRPRIEISAERLAALEAEFAARAGRRPTEQDRVRILEEEIADEIWLAEARARGLHERDGGVQTRLIQKMLFLDGETRIDDAPRLLERARELELDRDDIVVRRILIQKMKLLASALRAHETPEREAIEARYAELRESLREPDRIDLFHVFLSADARGIDTRKDAEALRRRLVRNDDSPERAIALGDPFPLGHRLKHRSERDLTRSFGAQFGPAALALDVGVWSEPVESAYGQHLIRVESRQAGQVPPLEVVADQLRRTLEHERQEAKLEAFQRALRARYDVALPAPSIAQETTEESG